MPGVPPNALKQLKDGLKNLFRRKAKNNAGNDAAPRASEAPAKEPNPKTDTLKPAEVKPEVTAAAPVAAPETGLADPNPKAAELGSEVVKPKSLEPESLEPVVKSKGSAGAPTIPTGSQPPATEPVEQALKTGNATPAK